MTIIWADPHLIWPSCDLTFISPDPHLTWLSSDMTLIWPDPHLTIWTHRLFKTTGSGFKCFVFIQSPRDITDITCDYVNCNVNREVFNVNNERFWTVLLYYAIDQSVAGKFWWCKSHGLLLFWQCFNKIWPLLIVNCWRFKLFEKLL